LVTWYFCEACGADEDISYCSFHRLFLCVSCDVELHSQIVAKYEAYQ
jgi:hypothetical protein